MGGCRLDTGAVVRDSVIGENSVVGAQTCTVVARATIVVDDDVHRTTVGAMVGDNVTLSERVMLRQGVRIGNGCTVGPNVDVKEDLPGGARQL
jgi:glucose-1-phosphate thymidylyltransferase